VSPAFPIVDPRGHLTPPARARLLERLKDPIWRLYNLYKIKTKTDGITPFVPNDAQAELIHSVHIDGEKLHDILKARQLGFSTAIALILFDLAYWNNDFLAAIVDQTYEAAIDKLKNKVRVALKHLAPELYREPLVDNSNELVFHNGSSVIAGKEIRGKTVQALHVSELGPITRKDPKRAEEIVTGYWPAAERGFIFNESTMDGGKGGIFFKTIDRSRTTPKDQRTAKDALFRFHPWYRDKTYTLEGPASAIPQDINDYFDEKEAQLGLTFTQGQRLWYAKTKAQLDIFMFREYPTTEDEAIEAPVKGAIYATILGQIRTNGQIRDFLRDPAYPVYSCWDIGYGDATSVWLFQLIGTDIYWLWHMRDERLTAAEAWHRVSATGIPISGNYLPHDAGNKGAATGLSYRDALANAGATHLHILPQPRDIWPGINAARDVLRRSVFHKTNCARGLEALQAYRTKEGSDAPEHDWSSHDADSFRYGAEAISLGLIKTASARQLVSRLDQMALATGMVDIDYVREQRHRRRATTALSD